MSDLGRTAETGAAPSRNSSRAVTPIPWWPFISPTFRSGIIFQKPDDPSSAEKKYFTHNEKWLQREGAYALIQSSKPQSLAHGLNDSPAGLAAWIVEKFRSWSDCGGDIESRFTKDELLTQIMIYWVTESIGSSFLPYYDFANASALTWIKEGMKKWTGSSKVPAAFALFPKDISQPPREWAERFFNVQRWTEMPRGGHFARYGRAGIARRGYPHMVPDLSRRELRNSQPVGLQVSRCTKLGALRVRGGCSERSKSDKRMSRCAYRVARAARFEMHPGSLP